MKISWIKIENEYRLAAETQDGLVLLVPGDEKVAGDKVPVYKPHDKFPVNGEELTLAQLRERLAAGKIASSVLINGEAVFKMPEVADLIWTVGNLRSSFPELKRFASGEAVNLFDGRKIEITDLVYFILGLPYTRDEVRAGVAAGKYHAYTYVVHNRLSGWLIDYPDFADLFYVIDGRYVTAWQAKNVVKDANDKVRQYGESLLRRACEVFPHLFYLVNDKFYTLEQLRNKVASGEDYYAIAETTAGKFWVYALPEVADLIWEVDGCKAPLVVIAKWTIKPNDPVKKPGDAEAKPAAEHFPDRFKWRSQTRWFSTDELRKYVENNDAVYAAFWDTADKQWYAWAIPELADLIYYVPRNSRYMSAGNLATSDLPPDTYVRRLDRDKIQRLGDLFPKKLVGNEVAKDNMSHAILYATYSALKPSDLDTVLSKTWEDNLSDVVSLDVLRARIAEGFYAAYSALKPSDLGGKWIPVYEIDEVKDLICRTQNGGYDTVRTKTWKDVSGETFDLKTLRDRIAAGVYGAYTALKSSGGKLIHVHEIDEVKDLVSQMKSGSFIPDEPFRQMVGEPQTMSQIVCGYHATDVISSLASNSGCDPFTISLFGKEISVATLRKLFADADIDACHCVELGGRNEFVYKVPGLEDLVWYRGETPCSLAKILVVAHPEEVITRPDGVKVEGKDVLYSVGDKYVNIIEIWRMIDDGEVYAKDVFLRNGKEHQVCDICKIKMWTFRGEPATQAQLKTLVAGGYVKPNDEIVSPYGETDKAGNFPWLVRYEV